MIRLQKQKTNYPDTWNESSENELERLIKLAREGLTFLSIKK